MGAAKIEGFDPRGDPFGSLFFSVSPWDCARRCSSSTIATTRFWSRLLTRLTQRRGNTFAAVFLNRHKLAAVRLALESHQRRRSITRQADRGCPSTNWARLRMRERQRCRGTAEPGVTIVVELAFDRPDWEEVRCAVGRAHRAAGGRGRNGFRRRAVAAGVPWLCRSRAGSASWYSTVGWMREEGARLRQAARRRRWSAASAHRPPALYLRCRGHRHGARPPGHGRRSGQQNTIARPMPIEDLLSFVLRLFLVYRDGRCLTIEQKDTMDAEVRVALAHDLLVPAPADRSRGSFAVLPALAFLSHIPLASEGGFIRGLSPLRTSFTSANIPAQFRRGLTFPNCPPSARPVL